MIIAIDGPAASGKGTIGRKLAAHFGLAFLDTGLLYRAATKRVLQQGISPFNTGAVIETIDQLTIEDTTGENLRSPEISSVTPLIAKIPEVRHMLVHLQREFAYHPPGGLHGSVLDGRDIATVICPEADVKLFITASLSARAKRRYKELLAQGIKTSFQAVHRDLRKRDEEDASRSASPLKVAEDATVVDTTDMSIDEAFAKTLAIVNRAQPSDSEPVNARSPEARASD
jgi:cytidylate kinase